MKKCIILSIVSILLISCYSSTQIETNVNTPTIAPSYTPKQPSPILISTNTPIPTVTPIPTDVINSFSPDEIESNINFDKLEQIYRRLDLTSQLFHQWDEPFSIETTNLDDKYTMLIVTNEYKRSWQYLVFRFETQHDIWHFLGHIDVYRGSSQGYRIANKDVTNNWLIVNSFCSGSGYGCTNETWYKLDGQELTESVSYLLSGVRSETWPVPVVQVWAELIKQGIRDGAYTLELDYRIQYDSAFNNAPFFFREGRVYYVWDEDLKEFSFDTLNSELEACVLDNPLLNSTKERVLCHYDNMLSLAKTGNMTQTKWLSEYLNSEIKNYNYPEKEELIDIINER
jgi:hypothetical protein